MRYQIRVRGGTPSQNATYSKVISQLVTEVEDKVHAHNALVAGLKNKVILNQAVQQAILERKLGIR